MSLVSGLTAAELHDVFAVMALIALGGVVLMIVARVVPTVPSFRFLGALHTVQLPLSAVVAGTATLGSLWFSERAGWQPCRFCWYQRIFMYSAAVVLVVAALRRDRSARWYAIPLAAIGSLISIWHILIEHRVVEESDSCTSLVSCANAYAVSFGRLEFDQITGKFVSSGLPITLAVMALSAFLAVITLLLAPVPLDPDTDTGVGDLGPAPISR